MIFKGPGGFGRVLNIVMCIVMCVVLSVIILSTMQGVPGNETLPIFTLLGFGVSFLMSFCVGYVVGDLFPALSWGRKLCDAFHIENKIAVHAVSSFVLAFTLITLVSVSCVWMTNAQSLGLDACVGIWMMVYPPLLGAGYLVILVILPLAMRLASAISGFDPNGPSPQKPAEGAVEGVLS